MNVITTRNIIVVVSSIFHSFFSGIKPISMPMGLIMFWVCLDLMYFSATHAQCVGNGLQSCASNFIGACTWDSKTSTYGALTGRNLRRFIPKVESFARTNQVAKICEPGNIGVVYDCANRVPLACMTVIESLVYQKVAKVYKRPTYFRQSHFIGTQFQPQPLDYKNALRRKPCYETLNSKYLVERSWWRYITAKGSPYRFRTTSPNPCDHEIAIHKGHLIASQYKSENRFTFVLTNSVPQFGSINSGHWNTYEQRLLYWAEKTVKTLLYISLSESYHQRMEKTITDFLVKQDSTILMDRRCVRQGKTPTGLTL